MSSGLRKNQEGGGTPPTVSLHYLITVLKIVKIGQMASGLRKNKRGGDPPYCVFALLNYSFKDCKIGQVER